MGKNNGHFDNLFDWNSDGNLDFWESAIDTDVYLQAHNHAIESLHSDLDDEYDEYDEFDEFDKFGNCYDEYDNIDESNNLSVPDLNITITFHVESDAKSVDKEIKKFQNFSNEISSAKFNLTSAFEYAHDLTYSDVADKHSAKAKKYLKELEKLEDAECIPEKVNAFIADNRSFLAMVNDYARQIEQEAEEFSNACDELTDTFNDHKTELRYCLQDINELIPQLDMAENFTVDGKYIFREYLHTALDFKKQLISCMAENFNRHNAPLRIKDFDNLFCQADTFKDFAEEQLRDIWPVHSGFFKDKCKVKVYLPSTKSTKDYYNDTFRLAIGDVVTVRNRKAVCKGIVTDINVMPWPDFSDPNRILSVDESHPLGRFYIINDRRITFDRDVLNFDKVQKYFDLQYDGGIFAFTECNLNINEPEEAPIRKTSLERGTDHYKSGRVSYLCLDGTQGAAMLSGMTPYFVKFEYSGGEITRFACSCKHNYICEHQVAAFLKLRETMEFIKKYYADKYNEYFVVASENVLKKLKNTKTSSTCACITPRQSEPSSKANFRK